MEANHHSLSLRSSNISAGFLVGSRRTNSSVLRYERTSFMKSKKNRYHVILLLSVPFGRSPPVKRLISSMPWHEVFAFLNPLLIGVIQVKCQAPKLSPFHTHPANMWTFLLATLVYCFAVAANKNCRRRRTIYALFSGDVALISGSLSSISLFSVFLPKLWGRLIFFSWIILPLLVLRQFIIYWPFHWTLEVVSRLLTNTRKKFNIGGIILDERPQV